MNEQFLKAAEEAKDLPSRPSNDVLLKMYALFKQGSEGDVTGDRPGGFDFKAIAKYDAWAAEKGKEQEAAKQEYVDLIDSLRG